MAWKFYWGDDSDEIIIGTDGDDRLHGGGGSDRIIGGKGRDVLNPGNDHVRDDMNGGDGADEYHLGPLDFAYLNHDARPGEPGPRPDPRLDDDDVDFVIVHDAGVPRQAWEGNPARIIGFDPGEDEIRFGGDVTIKSAWWKDGEIMAVRLVSEHGAQVNVQLAEGLHLDGHTLWWHVQDWIS
jgi:hypothetical protein